MWKYHKREETMNLDAYIFAFGVISMLIGYVIGRWEKQGEQTRTYRHGFNIGKQVGRNESK
jgi:hydrogenase/urease accessory protein HupE